MPRVFISYRRDDSLPYAGRLYDGLTARFGEDQIFMDIDTIEPGADFVEVIESTIARCDAMVAVIGKRWISVTDANGRRRLDNPNDYVRLEVAAGLRRGVRLIPVLVEGATMPNPDELPRALQRLARRNALELNDRRWRNDLARLSLALEKPVDALDVPKPTRRSTRDFLTPEDPHSEPGLESVVPLVASAPDAPSVGLLATQSLPPMDVGPPPDAIWLGGGRASEAPSIGDGPVAARSPGGDVPLSAARDIPRPLPEPTFGAAPPTPPEIGPATGVQYASAARIQPVAVFRDLPVPADAGIVPAPMAVPMASMAPRRSGPTLTGRVAVAIALALVLSAATVVAVGSGMAGRASLMLQPGALGAPSPRQASEADRSEGSGAPPVAATSADEPTMLALSAPAGSASAAATQTPSAATGLAGPAATGPTATRPIAGPTTPASDALANRQPTAVPAAAAAAVAPAYTSATPLAQPTAAVRPTVLPTVQVVVAAAEPSPTVAPTVRLQEARGLVAGGEYERAIGLLEDLKNTQPQSADIDGALVDAHLRHGRALADRGELDASYAELGRAILVRADDDDAEALDGQKQIVLAKNWAQMEAAWGKDDDTTLRLLREIMQLDAGYREVREKLTAALIAKADGLLRDNQREPAYQLLMEALQSDPNSGEARQRLLAYTPTPVPAPRATNVEPVPAQQPRAVTPVPQPSVPQPRAATAVPQPRNAAPAQPYAPSNPAPSNPAPSNAPRSAPAGF